VSDHDTSYWDMVTMNGNPVRVRVHVHEHEFLLNNTTDQPVLFVVDETLRKGWHIDSDPKPDAVNGQIATFRIRAEPKQVVRLHVGQKSR